MTQIKENDSKTQMFIIFVLSFSFFLFSINVFGQKVCLDTIQYVKGKPTFTLRVTKMDPYNLYRLEFTNCSRKNIYLEPADFDYNYDMGEHVELGKNYNELSDGRYYSPSKIKPKETVTIDFKSLSDKITLETTIIYMNGL